MPSGFILRKKDKPVKRKMNKNIKPGRFRKQYGEVPGKSITRQDQQDEKRTTDAHRFTQINYCFNTIYRIHKI